MSETTEFKDVYEAIASVSPNRQNILYTVLEGRRLRGKSVLFR